MRRSRVSAGETARRAEHARCSEVWRLHYYNRPRRAARREARAEAFFAMIAARQAEAFVAMVGGAEFLSSAHIRAATVR